MIEAQFWQIIHLDHCVIISIRFDQFHKSYDMLTILSNPQKFIKTPSK